MKQQNYNSIDISKQKKYNVFVGSAYKNNLYHFFKEEKNKWKNLR